MDEHNSKDREFVNSLAKGLTLLMCFTKEQPVWRLSDIARANGMNLPTAKRYLHTFTKMGFMIRDNSSRTFQLTPKVLRLGTWIIESMDIRQRLMPYMKSIRGEMDITTHCAVLEGNEVVTLERIRSSDVVNLDLGTGSRLPIHATSLGKAILAFLPEAKQSDLIDRLSFLPLTPHTIRDRDSFCRELGQIRARGYAVADQELTLGLKTIAVPIMGRDGDVEGSFGVSFPLSRAEKAGFEDELIARLLDVKKRA